VATAPTEVPVVELVSGIKSIKTPNLDGAKMFKVVESSPLFKRMSDEEKRMTLEKVYQSVGAKLGIEGAEDMSLDELYVRITNAN
jgi:hypothetical protein